MLEGKNEDLNSDNGAKEVYFEPLQISGQEDKDASSYNLDDGQLVTLEKNVNPLLFEEEHRINKCTSKAEVSVDGDPDSANQQIYVGGSGSLLPKEEDNTDEATSQAEESIGGDHKHEQSSYEVHSNRPEEPANIWNPPEVSKQLDCVESQKTQVVEETTVDSVLDQRSDSQSSDEIFYCKAPRKKRRLVIEMECSDEEPDLELANHSQVVADNGEDLLPMSSTKPSVSLGNHHFAQWPSAKSDNFVPSRPFPPKAEIHVISQTSPREFDDHVLARTSPLMSGSHIRAQPIIDAAWRGYCGISSSEYPMSFGLEAHLSNKAHAKVHGAASALPKLLDFDVVPKYLAWPKSFEKAPLTADVIGLYFFPVDERGEKVYEYLLDKMIERDMVLRSHINNLELLVFSSRELPLEERGFRRKYYLWGVFKPKKEPVMQSKLHDMEIGNYGSPLSGKYPSGTTYHRRDHITGVISSSASPSSIDGLDNRRRINSSNADTAQKSLYDFVELIQPAPIQESTEPVYCQPGYSSPLESSSVRGVSNREQYHPMPKHHGRMSRVRDADFHNHERRRDRDYKDHRSRRETPMKYRRDGGYRHSKHKNHSYRSQT